MEEKNRALQTKKETKIKYINHNITDDKEELISYIENNRSKDSFRVMMFSFIDQKGLKDADVYRRAGLTRNVFYCIKRGGNYKVSRKTAIRIGLSLELTLKELDDLLKTTGYGLNYSDPFDLIIKYYVERGIYDICTINIALNDIVGIIL